MLVSHRLEPAHLLGAGESEEEEEEEEEEETSRPTSPDPMHEAVVSATLSGSSTASSDAKRSHGLSTASLIKGVASVRAQDKGNESPVNCAQSRRSKITSAPGISVPSVLSTWQFHRARGLALLAPEGVRPYLGYSQRRSQAPPQATGPGAAALTTIAAQYVTAVV